MTCFHSNWCLCGIYRVYMLSDVLGKYNTKMNQDNNIFYTIFTMHAPLLKDNNSSNQTLTQ